MSTGDSQPWGAVEDSRLDGLSNLSDIDEDAPAFRSEPPLQYVALYAESQPEGGSVAVAKLGSILNRANLPNEACATILEDSTLPNTHLVPEEHFYYALAQASNVQLNPLHRVTSLAETLHVPMHELKLSDEQHRPDSSEDTGPLEYNPTRDPQIRVSVATKHAGSFLSKHTVYSIDGVFDKKQFRVLRRYRDFAWLASCLLTKYPFRVIPVLPPKRLSMNGRYLIGDSQDAFLSRRAAGLARFINLLVQHPILSKEKFVSTFLFVETQFDNAKRHHKRLDSEFEGKVASPLFISQWSDETTKKWDAIEAATNEFMLQVTTMCLLLERAAKRAEVAQTDTEAFGRSCIAMSRSLYSLYPDLQEDLGAIQQKLETVAQYSDDAQSELTNAASATVLGPLEQLKLYREMLSSVLELFVRMRTQGGNTVPALERNISILQRKLVKQSTKEDASEEELHKIRMAIQSAQNQIREQTNRDWLIKSTVTQELATIQTMQYQISAFLRSLASVVDSTASRQAELAAQLSDSAGSAPLKLS